MKRNHFFIIMALVIIVTLAFLIFRFCGKKQVVRIVNPAFKEYVQAFTSGVVSTHATIKVRLNSEIADTGLLDIPVDKKIFDFSPDIKGTAFWIDTRTIEFRPEKPLEPGQFYNAKFLLSTVLKVPDSLKTMEFQLLAMKQDLEVRVENHKAYHSSDPRKEKLYGTILTADVANDSLVEKTLVARQNGKPLPVTWNHEPKARMHYFRVDSVRRAESKSTVTLEWDGKLIGADKKGEMEIEIPALGDFRLLNARVVQATEPYIVAQFSDALQEDQSLEGVAHIGRVMEHRVSAEDNELRIYSLHLKSKKITLVIEPFLKNTSGKPLGTLVKKELEFENLTPNVRFIGDGVILPNSNSFLVPIEAVNLKAIDVKVTQIYEKNILQFLQINELSGQSELARVGKVILKKTMPLAGVVDYGCWNRFSIDMSTLIKSEPGAIYSVKISFKKKYSTFPCGETSVSNDPDTELNSWREIRETENDNYGYYNDYNEDYYDEEGNYGYRWEDRNNPCKNTYYSEKSITHNVYSSNLGIIAKVGSDGTYNLFVTDLVTAKPLPGVTVSLYDYQQKMVGSVKTDGDGKGILKPAGKPFVAIAKKDRQTGYLKLMEGSSLSVSMFDVSGQPVQKGLKGFIYGERGVWRPGDSLYLMFILEDKLQQLPEKHPVTFSLFNPAGQIVTHIVKTASVNGFYPFRTVTDRTAPTGNWMAKVKVGNAEFQKTIKIETIKPNHLKINLDFGAEFLMKDHVQSATLTSNWLTGAIAKNLKYSVNLTLTRSVGNFKNYPDFAFDNPSSGFNSEKMVLANGRLDNNGKASFTPNIRITHAAPFILNANFETTVYEQGGEFSVDRFTIPYFPYSTYVGIDVPKNKYRQNMLYTDRVNDIALINLDSKGNLVPSNKLKVEIYKLEWRWWWDNSETGWGADFVSTAYQRPVDSLTINTTSGKATFPLEIDNDDWGRYYIKVKDTRSGHVSGMIVWIDWYGYNRMPGGEKQAVSMLNFTADKQKYNVGEKVKITFPSNEGGHALLSLETGSKVLQTFWIPTTKGNTEFSLTATEEMSPNCYAYITLLQPHSQTQNDLPIRLYGVIPLMVEDPATHLNPQIIMKNVLVPGQNASITVKEEKGKAITYTLAVVDDGLLDLTRFSTPNPWSVFYAREALGVKTWDLFDLVMGAFSGELQRILSIGGDMEGNLKGNMKANRFKPMVKFFGPFELKPGQSKTHTFQMPQYIGSVRVMVVGGNNGAYGFAEKTVPVKGALMVLGTLPRVVGPSEMVKLPVTVFAMEKTIREVTVEVIPDKMFSLTGNHSKKLTFNRPGDGLVSFDLKVKDAIGTGKIRIIATSGSEKATNDIEIDIRNPNSKVTSSIDAIIQPGHSWKTDYKPVGISGTNSGLVELSSIPQLNLESRLNYLIRYPYGCVEQTTSAAFPQLFLDVLTDLSSATRQEIERNIKAAIQRIKTFQLQNGGVGYWPGAQYADEWATCYAGHFILEAEQKGYATPVGFIKPWKEFQKQKAISWYYNSSYSNNDLMQAYRLYSLALAKSPEMGAMNKLRELKNLSLAARWRLAAAYQLAGKPEVAEALIGSASLNIKPYSELGYSYGSDVRDKAMIIETLCLLNRKTQAAPLVKEISAKLAGNEWMSTQTTAYCLLAISKFTGMISGSGIDATYKPNDGKVIPMKTSKYLIQEKLNILYSTVSEKLEVVNNGKNIIYARIILQGIPLQGLETAENSNLTIKISYQTVEGRELNPSRIEQGTNFIARATISNPGLRGYYQNLALLQIFPSGWEIINTRLSEFAKSATAPAGFNYQDFRDDRVYTFFDLGSNNSKTFDILLNASYLGKFYLPMTNCEAMYDNTINARVPGRWVEVIAPVKE